MVFALPSISEFEKIISAKTKAIMICNPNNPTGYLYSKDELIQLKDICEKHDLFLFADEVYRDFCYDNSSHFSILELGLNENTIVIDSISKRYSACGARVGCVLSKNKSVMQSIMNFCTSSIIAAKFWSNSW
jgi:aspartate aminotransferase